MATSPRRAARPKKKTSVHAAVAEAFEPLQITSDAEPAAQERVVIAYLDDYELTMPARLPPNLGLRVARTARTTGMELAMAEMLEEVIGAEGYDRLVNFPGLTDENLGQLFFIVQKVVMGRLEVPKASSKNA